MILSFQELKSDKFVLSLVFFFNSFDDSRWVGG